MIHQQGSVLVGVLVFAVVLTLAAGGFLLTSSLAMTTGLQSRDSRRLQLAAESAMHLAIRYMRDESLAELRADPDAPEGWASGTWTPITPGFPGWHHLEDQSARTAMGDPLIKAAYHKDPDGDVTVFTWTAFAGSPSMLQVSWKITDAAAGGPYGMRNVTLRDWKDTLLAKDP